MKLFKNSVGRPSSKTLQKRKIAIFTIVFIVQDDLQFPNNSEA